MNSITITAFSCFKNFSLSIIKVLTNISAYRPTCSKQSSFSQGSQSQLILCWILWFWVSEWTIKSLCCNDHNRRTR